MAAKRDEVRVIATNPHVHTDYAVSELVEAGLVLTGTEVKSLRATSPNLREAFVEVQGRGGQLEAFLVRCHIGPYSHGNLSNHEPVRRRKLLLHRRQIDQIHGAITRAGMTVVPVQMYFKGARAKVELAVAKGKRKGDKRAALKQKSATREMDQAMKAGRQRRRERDPE